MAAPAAIPEDEWTLLANAIAEPLPQLIAVGAADTTQLREVERRLLELAGKRPFSRLCLNPGQDAPEEAWRNAQCLASVGTSALPLLIVVVDCQPQTPAQQRQLGEFWRGMNQLREYWHNLPAQVVFLLSPAAYRHLTLNADHLKRWIAPKVRLWPDAGDLEALARPGKSGLPHDAEFFFASEFPSGLESRRLSTFLRENLARQAEQQGAPKQAAPWRFEITPPQHYDVFLYHNSRDKPLVRQLKQAIASRNLAVWLDEEQLAPGENWQRAIESAIHASQAIAVCIGPAGTSLWQNLEMRAAIEQALRENKPVIPVLLPGAADTPAIPLFLRNLTWVDLHKGISDEGIARLVWGITGYKAGHSQDPSTG